MFRNIEQLKTKDMIYLVNSVFFYKPKFFFEIQTSCLRKLQISKPIKIPDQNLIENSMFWELRKCHINNLFKIPI